MNSKIIKTILIFGGLTVVILLIFQLEKWSLFALGRSENVSFVISGILFLLVGVLVSRYFNFNLKRRKITTNSSNLSDQELRVLQLVADGLSNKEIANHLFIAESTVKSHVSSILSKLNAKRRTEAVKIGQERQII